MRAPKLVDGDLVFENNEWIFVEGDEELAQSVEDVLQTRKGEFFLEAEHGISYDHLLGKRADQAEARDDIIEAISQENRIQSVTDVRIIDDKGKRNRSVSLALEKEDGTKIVLREVPVNAG
ncbi:hypothetical protein AWH48_11995 [Domibacillus aminovorans]|uniref:DUF2634 domain-containing protein n=1 Tax=Domibacillus aminovorans TaxID=29332 RepID=A0A177KI47_9BACI|nr:DUF2634 domain-containing protein [Domibacillus aminovorans]OAH53073.1 hypothetical protein AWH48_11995 [Domibacillus aminovorans]